MSKNMNLGILAPYPINCGPSQRFRFEQYLTIWRQNGIEITLYPFYSKYVWSILYLRGKVIRKTVGVLACMARRIFITLFSLRSHDLIFIHREAVPAGPPVVEWILTKVFRKRIIFDFDDALWLVHCKRLINLFLMRRVRVNFLLRNSNYIICGNKYLLDYCLKFNECTTIIPTTIDTKYHKPVSKINEKPTICWTGTHTTLPYLKIILESLNEINKQFHFVFLVISNEKPDFPIPNMVFKRWNQEDEIETLCEASIGVMPLPFDAWSKGKCGLKILQFMALGIPVVASDWGVNSEIIKQGHNGMLCKDTSQWTESLRILLEDSALRNHIGREGRKLVESKYSVEFNKAHYSQVLDNQFKNSPCL